MIIYDVSLDVIEDSLFVDNLIADNNLPSDDVRLVTKLKSKSSFSAVIEVNAGNFRQIMKVGYLYAGWNKCNINEHLNVKRCIKCCRYAHIKKDCNENVTCAKCSGSHET